MDECHHLDIARTKSGRNQQIREESSTVCKEKGKRMKVVSKTCLLFLILGFPAIASAAGLFNVQPGDKSLEYLSMIFGQVQGSIPAGPTTSLFGAMVNIFNQAVFGLGIVIISYTIAMGAIHTAHEGQFLGKNWHPILVPLRAGVGILLLIPQGGGYNYIQMMVMWFILQGVGAANTMWNLVIEYHKTEGAIHEDTRLDDIQNAQALVTDLLKANNCMQSLNKAIMTSDDIAQALDEPISVYVLGDTIKWGRQNHGDALCGSLDVSGVGASFSGAYQPAGIARVNAYKSAILKAQEALIDCSNDSLSTPMTLTNAAQLINSARLIESAARDASQATYNAALSLDDKAKINGWLLAGSYYYTLTQNGTRKAITFSFPRISPSGDLAPLISQPLYDQYVTTALTSASDYVSQGISQIVTVPTWARSGPSLILNPKNTSSSEGSSIVAALVGSLFEDITRDLQSQITGAGAAGVKTKNDPLVSMATFGSNLTLITENTFFAALGLAFALWMISTFMSCIQPFAHAFNFLLTIIMPIVMLMISLLWVAGLTLGLYIPMVPYLVFTFSALTWFILVIEAMLAAPLIALTLIVPSEDEIGKAGYAIMILLGVFLRPILMILGFILAIQLLMVGIGMLNAAFWPTMMASTGGSISVGAFGLIAILLLYASVALGMVHEAFSLIYLVPNKVMRWIGGGGNEDEGTMKNVQSLKGSVQKGAGIGAGLMKSSLKAFKK